MSNLSRERPLNMTEYICKQDAVDAIYEFPMFMECNEIYIYQKRIEKIPAADVVPVVHSQWEYKCGEIRCPECGNRIRRIDLSGYLNFCPNCGAKMDG